MKKTKLLMTVLMVSLLAFGRLDWAGLIGAG